MSCLECGSPLGPRQTKFCSRTCTNAYNGRVRLERNAEAESGKAQVCDCCGEDLPLSKFSKLDKNNPKAGHKTTCRRCSKNNFRREKDRKLWETNAAAIMWKHAKANAHHKGISFTITVEDIIIPERCPVLGVPFTTKGEYAPSIDKIDPTRGYDPDNITIVSRRANIKKSDMTLNEMRALVSYYETLIHA